MRTNKTWNTYPWWLLLVGFAFGVLVTLWATQGRVQTVTVYRDAGNLDRVLVQATQMVREATLTAVEMQQAAMSNHATANAFVRRVEQPGAVDPIFMTATAVVIEATQQAPR